MNKLWNNLGEALVTLIELAFGIAFGFGIVMVIVRMFN